MNWINNITCYHVIIILTVIFCLVIITCFAMFFNYGAKLSKDKIEFTKWTHRTEELEKKNGKEQHEIDELKKKSLEVDQLRQEIKELKEIIRGNRS